MRSRCRRAGVAAFPHGERGEHQGGDRVGPPPAEHGVEDQADQHRGRQVGAEQGLLGVRDGARRAELTPGAALCQDSNGITTTLTATSTIPTVECPASSAPNSVRTASTVT